MLTDVDYSENNGLHLYFQLTENSGETQRYGSLIVSYRDFKVQVMPCKMFKNNSEKLVHTTSKPTQDFVNDNQNIMPFLSETVLKKAIKLIFSDEMDNAELDSVTAALVDVIDSPAAQMFCRDCHNSGVNRGGGDCHCPNAKPVDYVDEFALSDDELPPF